MDVDFETLLRGFRVVLIHCLMPMFREHCSSLHHYHIVLVASRHEVVIFTNIVTTMIIQSQPKLT